MKNKNCTDIEQSQKLIELGIDISTADMYYAPDANVIVAEPYITKTEDETLVPAYKGAVPAWSLGELLTLIPNEILFNDEYYYLNLNKTKVDYRGPVTFDGQKSKSIECNNLVDAAFEMVVWLKENGIL